MKSTNPSEDKENQISERSKDARVSTSTNAGAREYFSKNRLETFSDAIFAIIITLLVLEIRIPELSSSDMDRELLASLINILPNLLALAVSFLTISVIWINHHRVFTLTKTIDQSFFWINANLIFWVTLIPLPTGLIGSHPFNTIAVAFYGLVLFVVSASFSALRIHIRHARLAKDDMPKKEFTHRTILSLLFGPALYGIGVAAAFRIPTLSLAVFIAIPIYFAATRDANPGENHNQQDYA
jgi:uncharacterized membrane protein